MQLPNVVAFVELYFALQKIGAIPICALATHRYMEISQFTRIAGAAACVAVERHGTFALAPMLARVQAENDCLKHLVILGEAPDGFVSFHDLCRRQPARGPDALDRIEIDPADPALFHLSAAPRAFPS